MLDFWHHVILPCKIIKFTAGVSEDNIPFSQRRHQDCSDCLETTRPWVQTLIRLPSQLKSKPGNQAENKKARKRWGSRQQGVRNSSQPLRKMLAASSNTRRRYVKNRLEEISSQLAGEKVSPLEASVKKQPEGLMKKGG